MTTANHSPFSTSRENLSWQQMGELGEKLLPDFMEASTAQQQPID